MIVCPNCGKENQDHYKFCLGCGSDLPRTELKSTPAPANTPPTGIPAIADDVELSQASDPSMAQTAYVEDPDDLDSIAREAAPPATDKGEIEDEPVQEYQPAPRITSPPASAAAPAEAPAEESDETKCSACGAEIPHGFAFCGACGQPVPGAASPQAPAPAPQMADGSAKLVLIQPDGTEGGHVEVPTSEVAVGRDAGGFFENDPFLSPTHAILCTKQEKVVIKDADSLNGLFLKILPNKPVEIKSGTIFRMGQELILFEEIDRGSVAPDGTAKMGSPVEGLWGRVALIVGRGRLGNAFPIGGDGVVLGRERGDILFPEDGYVSGIHLKLYTKANKFYIEDLGSSNGTFLKIKGEAELVSGSFVLMGQQLFRVDL